jgi:hypothetical protein
VTLAALAGRHIGIDDDERRSAARRALLVLAAGGDPSRGLDLKGPAVERIADELDAPDRRTALTAGLVDIRRAAKGLPHVTEATYGLLDAPDVAWRAYACSLLAEELDSE